MVSESSDKRVRTDTPPTGLISITNCSTTTCVSRQHLRGSARGLPYYGRQSDPEGTSRSLFRLRNITVFWRERKWLTSR